MNRLSNFPDHVELAYSKDTGWRAWILDGPGPREPGHVLATGCGDTPDEACACAVLQWSGAPAAATDPAGPERGTCTECGCVGQGACSESGGCFTAGAGSDAACDEGEAFADPLAAEAGAGAGWGSWRQRA